MLAGLLLSGCANLNNTPAQNLAQQRLQRCNKFPSVRLQSLKPDGSIVVYTVGASAVSEYPAWRQCMEDALAAQKTSGQLPADAQPSTVEMKVGR